MEKNNFILSTKEVDVLVEILMHVSGPSARSLRGTADVLRDRLREHSSSNGVNYVRQHITPESEVCFITFGGEPDEWR